MDVFEQLLTSHSGGRTVSAETLELLGTKASNMFLEKKASLNQAVADLASQHGELNNEHIHRITEFANNATFQKLFDQNHDKNVNFPVADPAVVIRDLRDGGSPAHDGKVLENKGDYHSAPLQGEKNSDTDPESGMQMLFNQEDRSGQFGQGESISKTASACLEPSWEGSVNPINDVYASHLRLKRSREEVVAEHEASDIMEKQARADFYRAVKTEVMAADGAGLGGVMSIVEKRAAQRELAGVVEGLLLDGVSPDLLEKSMRKTAGVVVNPNHPLMQSLDGLLKAAEHRRTNKAALLELDSAITKTASFLKNAR